MEKKMTGYPSIDKPWLKYYKEDAEQRATDIPEGKTVWDVIEEKLLAFKDIPAIEYFGRTISRPEFIEMVYAWAKAFKALGVKEDEVVPYYGPFLPDVGAMAFALNIIGACPYFLKLAISPEALAEETKEARLAIVFDDMWSNVSREFTKDRFEIVIFISAADGMAGLKKQIVSLMGKWKGKNEEKIPKGEKYMRINQALDLGKGIQGELRAPFVSNRGAFITSSSGTTVDGVVKGTVATNESTIAQLLMGEQSEVQYFPGEICLNNFPPTASTSLNALFFLPLYHGMKIMMDPRIQEEVFYKHLTETKPQITISTGSFFELFFNRVAREMKAGKRFDFSHIRGWYVGGEGTDVKKYQKWLSIVREGGGEYLVNGFGSSELFSVVTVEKTNARCDFSKPVPSVGIPYVGITAGIFDNEGKELPYNHRGELCIKSRSAMKEYYNKPELTARTKVDGWIHTGDLAEIDENGFVYIWGRCKDTLSLSGGSEIYLFDVANKIKEKDYIDDAIVLPILSQKPSGRLAAHIVWSDEPTEKEQARRLKELNEMMEEYLPEEL